MTSRQTSPILSQANTRLHLLRLHLAIGVQKISTAPVREGFGCSKVVGFDDRVAGELAGCSFAAVIADAGAGREWGADVVV
jgi:hypothetical protein